MENTHWSRLDTIERQIGLEFRISVLENAEVKNTSNCFLRLNKVS